uniref:dihydroorotase n=1 Tax=Methanoculleus chikugoensis TaxID=118126 RepID=UPI000ACFB23D
RLHFCHLSTAASVRAARGTVEVTPHHLFLSRENFDPDETRARVNPPLRDEVTRRNLWSCWDRIDVVASDHAPHTFQEKGVPFETAPSGIPPGVETMVPLLMAAVQQGRITLASVIEKTSWRPAAILGIPRAGFEPGDRADYALYPDEITRIDAPTSTQSAAGRRSKGSTRSSHKRWSSGGNAGLRPRRSPGSLCSVVSRARIFIFAE